MRARDTAAVFEDYVARVADAFEAPIALLTLLASRNQWIKASHGIDLHRIPRSISFCTHAVDREDLTEVCDASLDTRFAQNPLVTAPPSIRYYLGAPLRLTSGIDVGALCVIDNQAREPASADQRAYLRALARQAAFELEMRSSREAVS